MNCVCVCVCVCVIAGVQVLEPLDRAQLDPAQGYGDLPRLLQVREGGDGGGGRGGGGDGGGGGGEWGVYCLFQGVAGEAQLAVPGDVECTDYGEKEKNGTD